ncbi:C2H2 zinc finger domain-containing protein [Histoplasma capsulatum var. duboisii H88]|uniref:C2H2 zinc finger domain-containing protein n=1 Tax=Ajellomyces capsulatus (strain H88) TaxID=544711 RepID=A0A8A1LPY3_AJEC8|nr:C2H2 zinc finger domain-containing protein [Histoplasma capsulatum var. duboisii H88]
MPKRSRKGPLIFESSDPDSQIVPEGMGSPTSPHGKLAHLDDQNGDIEVMRCSLPPHKERVSFSSYEDYEVHYAQEHVNRCLECGKNFPTGHFLTLHIEELHDPIVASRRERGEKTFSCFVEGCNRKCSTSRKRRLHLIDKHQFPRLYNFSIVNTGIDQYNSMLRGGMAPTHRRRVSVPNSVQHENRLRRRKLSQSTNGESPTNAEPPPKPSNISAEATICTNLNSVAGGIQLPLHVKPGPVSATTAAATSKPKPNDDINDKGSDIEELEKSMSALMFVPTSVALRMDGTKQRPKQGR